MSINEILEVLDNNDEVMESYVLLREIKTYLNIGHDFYHPQLKIKIYRSSVIPNTPYHFDVSHHSRTPDQAGPYHPSRTSFESESEAIHQAISTTTSFIKHALDAGHEPSDEWLIPNEDF